jgi:Lon protease-like protein
MFPSDTATFPSNVVLNEPIDFSRLIPIFPLPNVVLMPRAILPLHVFEPRYRVMTRDALAGTRLIAMAVLKPCDDVQYESLVAEIHPELCVGRILREERLTDGRYNFLLQGVCRARVISEDTSRPYRRGELECVCPVAARADVEGALRRDLRRLLNAPSLENLAADANWLDLLDCPECGLSDLLDALASAVLVDIEDKRRFLAEPRVATRGACICEVLAGCAERLQCRRVHRGAPRSWPPTPSEN